MQSVRTTLARYVLCVIAWSVCLSGAYAEQAPPLRFNIRGISGDMLTNVRNRLAATCPQNRAQLPKHLAQRIFLDGFKAIRLALEPYGYFHPHVHGEITPNSTPGSWLGKYQIELGPILRVAKTAFTFTGAGHADPNVLALTKTPQLQNNHVFSPLAYRQFKQEAINHLVSNGYLSAQFTHTAVSIDPRQNTANVTLQLNTGAQHDFGPTVFKGNLLDTAFLRQYVQYQQGDPFDSDQLFILQSTLMNTHYFRTVHIEPGKINDAQRQIPITIHVAPKKAKQYSAGIGYSSDLGLSGLLGADFRRITRSGHHLSARLNLSRNLGYMTATYVMPGRQPAIDQYIFNATIQRSKLVSGVSRNAIFSASLLSALPHQWQRTLSMIFLYEKSYPIGKKSYASKLVYPSLDWVNMRSNHEIDPDVASRFRLNILGSPKLLGSNISFFQARTNIQFIRPLGHKNLIMAKLGLGSSLVNNLSELPLSLQFFTGGAQSLRGYAYNSIGPGTHLRTLTLELRHRIRTHWYLTAFTDMGMAANSLNIPMKRSAGIGTVWISPVGGLEFSLAKPVNIPNAKWRLQFSISQNF